MSFAAASNDLAAEGIALWVANVRKDSWDLIVAALAAAGAESPPSFDSVADAVAHFEQFGTADPGSDS